ncbi:MAG: sugar transferase [Geothrix sp.]|uniref:sugar transferase n=1 Tax=Geothrix sp. TaxID=1962974 RepID=UPI0017968520|nr:sugar transferase [Geothrix sp.]NWJ42564.1 sugar transferase [Geothrix sp.]WIL19476.1 MAG: sugar transferase [Geothrix sp.]
MAKRAFDLFWSILGLVILSPLLVLAALLVKLEDGGPVFFRQVRIGREGRPFRIWKFRTMVVDAERMGRSITVGQDARITRVGARLRDTKLDELPQLLNVVAGDMSLVGPRPEVPRYVELYSEAQRAILALLPGITDLASIKYRHESELLAGAENPDETYVQVLLPDKIRINLAYAARAGVWSDFLVILATLGLFPPGRIRTEP